MSGDTVCFCGSKRRHKKCHPDIFRESLAAKMLSLYARADTLISSHYSEHKIKPVCRKGCSECCSTVFCVSIVEFFLICRELIKFDQKKIALVKHRVIQGISYLNNTHPELFKYFRSAFFVSFIEAIVRLPQCLLVIFPAEARLSPLLAHCQALHAPSPAGHFQEAEIADLFLHFPAMLVLFNSFVPEHLNASHFLQRLNFYYWIYKNSSLLPSHYVEQNLLVSVTQKRTEQPATSRPDPASTGNALGLTSST